MHNGIDLVEKMRIEKTSRGPLKQNILLKKSNYEKIFVFEGDDDYSVYDEWMKRNEVYCRSGHIVAKGKRQIIELYEHSKKISDEEIMDSCMFFVDHDYDLYEHNENNIVTLSCYSIENYIVDERSVRSYIIDEFKMDVRNESLRDSLIEDFKNDLADFYAAASIACEPLFINHNLNDKAKFYSNIKSIIHIEHKNVKLKTGAQLIAIEGEQRTEEIERLRKIYSELSYERKIKGKYLFEFIKSWLSSVKVKINGENGIRITKDPLMVEMRRLAGSSKIPAELVRFS